MRGWPLVGRSSIENDRNLRRHLILKNCFLEFGLFKTPCCLQDVPRRGLSVQRVPSWFCGQWSPTMPTWGHEAASCVSHRGCLWWFDVAEGYSGSFRLFPRGRQLFWGRFFVFLPIESESFLKGARHFCLMHPAIFSKGAKSWGGETYGTLGSTSVTIH